ncbi:MAG: OmpA family protein [Bacteroidota bacterium]
MKKLLILCLSIVAFTACNKQKVANLEREVKLKDEQITQLEEQIENLTFTNTSLLDRMADMSIVNKAGAESIQQSLENINNQYDFIQDLTTKIQSKDSLNLALVMNLKRSLSDVNDRDVQVEVRGGVVYVSISDQMLFSSGSYRVNSTAKDVLEKVASVINDHDDIDIMVEGHTDDVPINLKSVKDNWDLSVLRATSVVRVLEKEYFVDPERMTAAGRSEFLPKEDNTTAAGRVANRRTEIVITPRLDQYFKLLEAPEMKN